MQTRPTNLRKSALGLTYLTMALVVAQFLVGCATSRDGSTTTSPSATAVGFWQDRINQALSDPGLTTFERSVLSDDVITDAEYREAQARFISCMADRGWTVIVDANNQYTVSATAGGPGTGSSVDPGNDNSQCSMGTLNYIEPIYLGMKNNPRGLTPGQQMRACYDSHNVADGKGMSDDEFQAMLDDPMYHPSSPDALVCYYDPTGALGITAEQAAQADANKSSQPAVTVTAPSTPSGK